MVSELLLLFHNYLQLFHKKQLEYPWVHHAMSKTLVCDFFFIKLNNIKFKSQQNRPDLVLVSVVKGMFDQEVF